MLSIITSIYNLRDMNELYYNSLVRNTKNNFELIIVDNNSDDGSREFFEKLPDVKVINTGANYNYPYCQNRGIEAAKYDLLCFFNNDIIVSKNWDEKIINILQEDKDLLVASVATNDHLESMQAHKKISRRWKMIKNPLFKLFGASSFSLKFMLKLMYPNFDQFTSERYHKWHNTTIEGYSGSAIVMRRRAFDIIGFWDERLQAADFDLFNRVKEKSNEGQNIKPIQLALGVYFHHFQKLTVKQKYPPFANKDQMIQLTDKWGDRTKELRQDIV